MRPQVAAFVEYHKPESLVPNALCYDGSALEISHDACLGDSYFAQQSYWPTGRVWGVITSRSLIRGKGDPTLRSSRTLVTTGVLDPSCRQAKLEVSCWKGWSRLVGDPILNGFAFLQAEPETDSKISLSTGGDRLTRETGLTENPYGKLVTPMRKRSHSRAAPRPSLMAQTTSD